jgi:hypothetical protein
MNGAIIIFLVVFGVLVLGAFIYGEISLLNRADAYLAHKYPSNSCVLNK